MKTLQAGKTYKDGNGTTHLISRSNNPTYQFTGTTEDGSSFCYTSQGKFAIGAESEYDLIIPEEDQEVQHAAKPEIPHLEVILAIAQSTPVQYDFLLSGTWHDFEVGFEINPVDFPQYNWRIKPEVEPKRTVVIGKRTVVAPEVEAPELGSEYWLTHESYTYIWANDSIDNEYLEAGRVFLDRCDAKICSDALTHVLLGKD